MKKGEKRKQELLKIAYELFLSRGYENTSVDEIIAKAQIAKGTYYYYFPSKEQMLEDIIDMMIENEAEAARQILQRMAADGAFDRVVLCYIDGNTAARRLYEKLGFRPTGESDGDEIIMEKQLR